MVALWFPLLILCSKKFSDLGGRGRTPEEASWDQLYQHLCPLSPTPEEQSLEGFKLLGRPVSEEKVYPLKCARTGEQYTDVPPVSHTRGTVLWVPDSNRRKRLAEGKQALPNMHTILPQLRWPRGQAESHLPTKGLCALLLQKKSISKHGPMGIES